MNLRKTTCAALILLSVSAPQGARRAAAAPTLRMADHVIVVMLDGCRPDILRRANAPVLHGLAAAARPTCARAPSIPPRRAWPSCRCPPAPTRAATIVGGGEVKDKDWQTLSMGNGDPIAAQFLVARPTFFEAATAAGLTSLYAGMKGYELVGARGATWTINGKKTLKPGGVQDPLRRHRRRGARTGRGLQAGPLAGAARADARHPAREAAEPRGRQPGLRRLRRPTLRAPDDALPRGHRVPRRPEGDLLKALDEMGIRGRTTIIVSAITGSATWNRAAWWPPHRGRRPSAGGVGLARDRALPVEHRRCLHGGVRPDKARIPEAVPRCAGSRGARPSTAKRRRPPVTCL